MNEGVDTSYTKFGLDPKIDDNPYNKVVPPADLLYVGWTEPGEWFNLTVDVAHAESIRLTCSTPRTAAGHLDRRKWEGATGPLKMPVPYDAADPLAWRQWHHWNLRPGLRSLQPPAGKAVLTVHILTEAR